MRFSLPDSYFEFFLKHQILEIEDLLSINEADQLCLKAEALILKRLSQKPLDLASNLELWKAGKNLWKDDPVIKKILFRLQFGEMSHFLFKKRPIRLAYAQTLFTENTEDCLFSQNETLPDICCIGPLLGGALLCLRPIENQETETHLLPNLALTKKGRVFFFSDKYPIPFPELFKQKGLRTIILYFSPGKVRYKLEPKDPLTHALKKEGYAFGDLLKEETCPYLYR